LTSRQSIVTLPPVATWNPAAYLQFSVERFRPFFDLTARIAAADPRDVVDLGCGPGQLTASLAERWPRAQISGIDSSPDMIETARSQQTDRVRFELGDVETWHPSAPVDVLLSNAALQWVPGHRDLLPRLVGALSDNGWLAFQVPGNFAEPSHQLLRSLAGDPRFAAATHGVRYPDAFDAQTYLCDLAALNCRVDAWETTYLHVLAGEDAVFRWISGTGARPVLQALADEAREQFVTEYKAALRAAYPMRDLGTVLPFRRVFVVAQRLP
jgi:trans-aconitate 2-methyltransferase